jgi:hypothetical protein
MSEVQDIDKGYQELRKVLLELGGAKVTIGFHEDAGAAEGGLTVAEVASFHEFGLGVPQRAFLAPTIDEGQDELATFAGKAALAVMAKKLTPDQALGRLGEKAKNMVQETLRKKRPEWRPLAKSTIEKKANKGRLKGVKRAAFLTSDGNPLIDTGQMINSVSYKVDKR